MKNKACKINKLLGKSPNRRIQQLSHMLNNSPGEQRKAICKNLIPDMEEELTGKIFKQMKKNLGENKNKTYNFLSELTTETEPKHTTFLMKNYGLSRPKAKRLYIF